VNENTEADEEDEEDSETDSKNVKDKDQFEMIKSLRRTIHKKYKIIEVIGKGSYGCVSKAKCKETGRMVALKVMKN
jgi:serine/threonine protein kinase